ncbi:serine/threonine-protein kinase haspin homolog isoform X1 [Neltuma alba]|uniref:serine/threonine-protein kinase haspin homolog isoform X1 n=1 Tax=Neltuma alba TaxID=207710 RepID=UPI0010A4214C|nr:serine/threonine-protein kinase haspin homolog isoform X1 [Prosopis alba]
MGSKAGGSSVDLWAEIVGADAPQQQRQQVEVVYRRRKPQNNQKDLNLRHSDFSRRPANRVSLVDPNKRVSWNRSLSTRGRTSIAVGACMVYQPELKKEKRKGKPALPKGKFVAPPNFEKERAYFEEVDAFELLEESPSPKKVGTWTIGNGNYDGQVPHLCSRLEKWLLSRKLNLSCGPSSTLSKILDTPARGLETIYDVDLCSLDLRTSEKSAEVNPHLHTIITGGSSALLGNGLFKGDINLPADKMSTEDDEDSANLEAAVKKLSLTSSSAFTDEHFSPFAALLEICGQSMPSKFQDVLSKYCDPETIVKVGEGTYGEAFKIGSYVCKIVPIDGDFRVNGEVQKRAEELLEEVVLSKTLNYLRVNDGDAHNSCRIFIETIELSVCQGSYDASLIQAWENWDENHGSENDHPKVFPEKQCYVVFVLQHGGKDLESFALMNFDEARSLLVQVTAGLAAAESAYEFEHRDLHWGNILLSRNDSETSQFTLDGRHMLVKTYGLIISIIDFTLSRINTGDDVLFLDLSSDPDLFKGPKGDKQSETYRKMKEVTEDWWEGSFPRTNVLWLIYLVDILLTKKSFERTSKNERDLRSLKKRLDKYNCAKEAISDSFFNDLLVVDGTSATHD